MHAHPEPTSFTTAQAGVIRESLQAQGCAVELIDLYAAQWSPVLDRAEFPPFEGPFKPQREQWNAIREGALRADVSADLAALFQADLLVLSFPLWWFSMPAVLKGWLDRVFVMGGVSGGDIGVFENAALTGRRALVSTTTGGTAEMFTSTGAFGDIDDFLFHVHRGVLEFVGYEALQPVVTYGPAHLSDLKREAALCDVRGAIDTIASRPLAATARIRELAPPE